MSRLALSLAFAASVVLPLRAQDKPAPGAKPDAPAAAGKPDAVLPASVLDFYGKIEGTVESVDAARSEFKIKVTAATADPAKNKAPKPEELAGMVITVTPLEKTDKDGKRTLDGAASDYIKGAKAGDPVRLNVRASSKGVVFRLLKVPAAAAK